MSSADSNKTPVGELLIEVRQKIYPRSVTGIFAKWRWGFVWLTQIVFYCLPWLRWNDRQAVLFDLAARKFYIFGLVLHPQDFIYLTGLLVISAMSLFLFTTVAGRLWCGFACPQTVYTEIYLWMERLVEGERGKRMKLDAGPMNAAKFRIKATKQALFISFALITGFTFVGYFTPIRELLGLVFSMSLGPWQTFWILFYALATYGNAGFLREQVCKYMCPYARFQGVMVDSDTLVITYDPHRGDPRGQRARGQDPSAIGLGDCIDCGLCVQVCPTGIDIRDGQQYECIGCAACIDACDKVMDKLDYPRGLIRYDTLNGMEKKLPKETMLKRVLRPRVFLYSAVLLIVSSLLLFSIATRVPFKVDVIRDRGALSREVKNGVIENVYRLMIINSKESVKHFTFEVKGLDGIFIDSETTVELDAASNRLVPVRVRLPPKIGKIGSNKITFIVYETGNPDIRQEESASFYVPKPL